MRTQFSTAQLADPHIAEAEKSLRACMHCGICTATCPTYVLLGDERDGPRGRIVMMQRMLEQDAVPSAETVLHVDRCLSCLACRTACPSSVDYARLVDTARAHIETHYKRPPLDRFLRWFIATVMSRPSLVRTGLALARLGSVFGGLVPGRLGEVARAGARMKMPGSVGTALKPSQVHKRVALMPGCVQAAVAPEIDAAVARVFARRGIELVPLAEAGCCGALAHHLGREENARHWAKRAIEAFERGGDGCDAILITATGCGAHLKDLAYLFSGDALWEPRARAFAAKFRDVSELVSPQPGHPSRSLRVAYHSACSAQNGLRLSGQPQALLRAAGFEVVEISEGHLCCGSAGSYSLLQPDIARDLRQRKLGNIAATAPDVVATGNIGCLTHLSGPDAPPVVHFAELIDWADGGAMPAALLAREGHAR